MTVKRLRTTMDILKANRDVMEKPQRIEVLPADDGFWASWVDPLGQRGKLHQEPYATHDEARNHASQLFMDLPSDIPFTMLWNKPFLTRQFIIPE